ncbi:hypothetical protein MKW98_026699, partial [Papaver atlanticum]
WTSRLNWVARCLPSEVPSSDSIFPVFTCIANCIAGLHSPSEVQLSDSIFPVFMYISHGRCKYTG